MKRLLFLTVCLMLVGAVSAQAELIGQAISEQDGPVTVSAVGTSYNSDLDKIVISVAGITGGSYVSAIEGVWSVTGPGAGIALPLSSIHEKYELGTLSNGNQPYMVDTGNSDPESGCELYSSFAGAWYSINAVDMPCYPGTAAQTWLAVIFVTKSTTELTFGDESGPYHSSQVAILGDTTHPEHFTVGAVPEPSTIVLLASGLMGLLCYAWRKRK
jgi:hypothetical protein